MILPEGRWSVLSATRSGSPRAPTGKTLSTMYLLGAVAGRTTILLTGRGLGLIEQALAIGRELAPAASLTTSFKNAPR